jgi:hypothetical protein
MTRIADLPLMEVILAAEEKHGIDTHMVIEAVPKHEDVENESNPLDTDVVWYVEFKELVRTFFNFSDVKKFLLEEVDSNTPNLVIPMNNEVVK